MNRTSAIDYAKILIEIYETIRPFLNEGTVADYIPELAHISPQKFGMAVLTSSGELFTFGDAAEKFSVQSISKVFTLTLAMQIEGDAIWQRLGREPSGTAFNSLVQLEYENGIPRNPFINAGAMVVTDMILSQYNNAQQIVLDFVRHLSDCQDIEFDTAVARSDLPTGSVCPAKAA